MPRTHWQRGTRVQVQLPKDGIVDAEVVRVPFFEYPTKDIPKTELAEGHGMTRVPFRTLE